MSAIANMTSYYAVGRHGQRLSPAECVRRLADNGFTHIDMNLCGMADMNGLLTGDSWREEAEAAREAAERPAQCSCSRTRRSTAGALSTRPRRNTTRSSIG